ncbi:MAG: hypothetical protein KDA97_13805, partial [Acidimicrobiales bacterium]|nr:hypothetical protein [Acidimicrobiales bacterium]
MLSSQAHRFGDALVERRVITREEMEGALDRAAASGQSFPEVVLQSFYVPPSDVAAAWASVHGMKYIDFTIEVLEPDAVVTIPASLARAHRAVPVTAEGGEVVVAFEHPVSAEAVEAIADHLTANGHELVPGLAEEEGITAALNVAYPEGMDRLGDTTVQASEASIEIGRLFDRTIELGGSDLHLA